MKHIVLMLLFDLIVTEKLKKCSRVRRKCYIEYSKRDEDKWFYGVMAITLDFESNNPSSNLGRT